MARRVSSTPTPWLLILCAAAGACSRPGAGPRAAGLATGPAAAAAPGGDAAPAGPTPLAPTPPPPDAAPPPPPPVIFRTVEPPAGPGPGAHGPVVAARVFAFADSQLHHPYGKRTFAQSPWADRTLSLEVAVRPAAVDDGADLLLAAFLEERRLRHPRHTPVFLGDASDLSCTQEMGRFFEVLRAAGESSLLAVASNHDGFYAGNFTEKRDADGGLAVTDMPHDWTRACADPPGQDDRRLTKGRAVRTLAANLPPGPAWATHLVLGPRADEPSGYAGTVLAYARPLGGGDPGAPPVWGLFVDTVDYQGFDLAATRGAGTTGAVSGEQLLALDRTIFEASLAGPSRPRWLAFGHHPFDELEPRSRARLARFLDGRPEILGYVSAHTHTSNERAILLPSGRAVPELIVGSTTDAPQAARLIEVRVERSGREPGLASWRLVLDAEATCAGVPPLPPDTLGYVGYRLVRDDTPDASIDLVDKISFGLGLSKLAGQRITQTIGALLVENDLVRALARLHREAPGGVTADEARRLDALLARRFRAGDDLAALAGWMRGRAPSVALDGYDRWIDPVLAPVVPSLARALHSFGAERPLLEALHAHRAADPRRRHYYLCHAVHAAAAEARVSRRRAGVTYVP